MSLFTQSLCIISALLLASCNAFTPIVIQSRSMSVPLALEARQQKKAGERHREEAVTMSTSRRAFSVAAITAITSINPSKSVAANQTPANSFLGTYSDPINHPGGTRTIKILGDTFGDYKLAQVYGGGGIGEPKEFVLPAIILGDRAIIIDFSPKGGPRDFTGVLEKDGSIRFLQDGNRWPRIG